LIERYTLPEMGQIWSTAHKLQTWLQVELAVCEAQAELGRIPQEALQEIRAKAAFDPARVLEIEAEVKHDVIAFLTNLNEHVGEAGRYIHLGLTSSDVLDTALAVQLWPRWRSCKPAWPTSSLLSATKLGSTATPS
jgi:Adenylosuccinate lyase (EC 4.3.2.2)